MVRVVRIEAVQDEFHPVGLAVLVIVDEQGEVGFLRDVHAFRGDLEADRDMELVGEDGLLVGLAVAVRVLEDQDLVVGQGVTRAVVGVGRRRGDPEAAFGVERHLDGLLEVGELLLGGEERHLVAGGELHLLDGGLAGKELRRVAVLFARLEVGGHRRQDERLGVVDGQVGALALGDAVDEFVAERGHLAALEDFVGVVLRAERVVALAVGVDAVEDRVIRVPHVILHLHRAVHEGFVGLGDAGRRAVKSVGEELGDFTVTEVGRGEAVDGVGGLALAVGGEGGVEEVDEGEAVLFGDAFHGGDVEFQVGVFLPAVGQVAGRGEVLEGDRGDEHQTRRSLAVVGLGQRMGDEGVDLGFVVRGAAGAVERLVVAEERDDGVGLEVEEPLVRRGKEALPVMLGVLGMELFGAREGPLARARRVRTESRGVAGTAHVAHDQVLLGEAKLQFRLESTVVGVAFGEAVADEDDAFAGGRRGDLLAALRGRGRRVLGGCVRRRRALAVVRPVGGVGLVFLGLELAVIGDRLVGGEDAGGQGGQGEEDGAVLHERGTHIYMPRRQLSSPTWRRPYADSPQLRVETTGSRSP